MILKLVGIACAVGSILFDLLSYWKQISKTLRTKKSTHVSSSAYLMKLCHYTCSIAALVVFANWVGLLMETFAFVACLICLGLIVKYKPKNWSLF